MTTKQQAIYDLDRARILLSSHMQLASEEFSPKLMLTRSVRKYPWAWIGGSVLGGLFLVRTLLPQRQAKIERDNLGASAKKSGLIALILTSVLGIARQNALKYGSQYLQTYLTQHFSRHEGEGPRA